MNRQDFICDKSHECDNEMCGHKDAHNPIGEIPFKCCSHAGFTNCVCGSVCVPVASQETDDTKPQPETERGTSDPDAVLARSLANDDDVVCDWSIIKPLLFRLADKAEGKS